MSYNILGINFSHNASVCVLKDGKVDFFLEEDRFSRRKYDYLPDTVIKYISNNYKIDAIAFSGVELLPSSEVEYKNPDKKEIDLITWNGGYIYNNKKYELNNIWYHILKKYFPGAEIYNLFEGHHAAHASVAFCNSGFNKSIVLVIDGSGSIHLEDKKIKFETESIFKFENDFSKHKILSKSYREINTSVKNEKNYSFWNLGIVYDFITLLLDFDFLDAGKTMGLSSYGKDNPLIPNILNGTKGSNKFFCSYNHLKEFNKKRTKPSFLESNFIKKKYQFLFKDKKFNKDLAYRVQNDCEIATENLIKNIIKETNTKNICCAGGFFLNCVNNYKLVKKFPNINFYFEPLCNDAGISMGASKLLWHDKTKDKTIRPQKTLYYGPKYSKEEILKGIKKYLD